jgi:formylglycine-generating enzyme required for sulfatase activity
MFAKRLSGLLRQYSIVAIVLALPFEFASAQEQEYVAPRQMVTVRIENPDQIPLKLFRINGDDWTEAITLQADKKEVLSIESGLYTLLQTDPTEPGGSTVTLPVPAWAPALPEGAQDLTIRIAKPPATRPGLCWIPAGPALLGDTLGVGQPDERPVRIVDLPGFWIGETEVTNAEYAEFLNDVGKPDPGWLDLESRLCRIKKIGEAFETGNPALPVVTVTYAGALAWCDWKSKKTGLRYRLPGEAEWEKAARGPASNVFSYGNVYNPQQANQESGVVTAVREFGLTGFGVYDITGNVFEWVARPDNLEESADARMPYTHYLRGGSFVLDGMYLRNSFRMRQNPEVMTDDIGFRYAVDDKSEPAK